MKGPENLHTDAHKYQLGMGSWSQLLAARFVDFIETIRNGDSVLDVGCGTGSLTFAIARMTKAGAVVGIDRSPGYLDYARAQNHFSHVSFKTGDARKLPFSGAVFDFCVSALMIQFVPDAMEAVREMVRVTRRGGIIATCLWDGGGGMELTRKFWQAAAAVDPGARKPGDSPYKSASALVELWRAAGLENLESEGLSIVIEFPCFDDFWCRYSHTQGPAKPYLISLSAERIELLRNRLRQDLLGKERDGTVRFNATAWAVKGQVP